MREPAFYICENKGSNQLRVNCLVDQCTFLVYSTSPVLLKSEVIFCGCTTRFVSGPGLKPQRQVFS